MIEPVHKDEPAAKKPPRFRFTLGTMFIVMAMLAGTIALFIRYLLWTGLVLAVPVLCAGWCFLRGNRARAAGYLAVFIVFWLAMQFLGPYTSLRNRVVWLVGTERLQQWAVETMDNPPPPDEYGIILLDRDTLPEDIRRIAGHYNQVLQDGSDKRIGFGHGSEVISFGHGGNVYHRSIIVGRPGFTPSFPHKYDKIADGVWGYYDFDLHWNAQRE